MGYFELYQESPGLLLLVLCISIVLTLFAYDAFPVIFAKSRKTPITKKKYKRLCYGINVIGFVLFAIIDGAAQVGPYLLWTWIFSSAGVKTLEKKGLLLETEPSEVKTTEKSDNETNQNDTSATTEKTIYSSNLSYPDEPQKKYGNYNVYGKDIAYIPPENVNSANKASFVIDKISKSETVDEKQPKKQKVVKKRYCKMCGSAIDNKTKVCTGCEKKYFKWGRFFKIFTIIVLALALAATSTLCVVQYVNTQEQKDEISDLKKENSDLEKEISNLERQNSKNQTTINSLKTEINELKDKNSELLTENWNNWSKVNFFDSHAEIVGDDGTKVYHKWGCSSLDTSNGFWIFNSEAAQGEGYKKCSYCH